MFTRAQLQRRSKMTGGLATARKAERGGQRTARDYLLRGLVRCGVCSRKMQGATIRSDTYYRCATKTLAPGSAALADHPKTVNLREDSSLASLNRWIGRLSSHPGEHQRHSCRAAGLTGAQQYLGRAGSRNGAATAAARKHGCESTRSRSKRESIQPRWSTRSIAQAERASAQAAMDEAHDPTVMSDAVIYAPIDSPGDVGAALAEPNQLHVRACHEESPRESEC